MIDRQIDTRMIDKEIEERKEKKDKERARKALQFAHRVNKSFDLLTGYQNKIKNGRLA